MLWSKIDQKILKEKKEIQTDFGETLSWEYYSYVKENPIINWKTRTTILYGSKDNLTEREIIDLFVKKYSCNLDVMENGEHYFNTAEELKILDKWIETNI